MSSNKPKRAAKAAATATPDVSPKKQKLARTLSTATTDSNGKSAGKSANKSGTKQASKEKPKTITEKKYAVAQKYVDENKSELKYDPSTIQYTGYIPQTNMLMKDSSVTLDIVEYSEIDSERFYQQYIAHRRPCIINNALTDSSEFKQLQQWNNLQYLRQRAGSQTVTVEHRANQSGEYGRGNKKQMQFNEFIDLLEQQNELHYLSTQPTNDTLHVDEQLIDAIVQPPLTALLSDFPLQPILLQHLIPYQYNIWAGCSKNWSSSSLHHDFHDNLYVLLSGIKRFCLFPPSDVYAMKPYGTVHTVHPNGLINYTSCITREDGVPVDLLDKHGKQTESKSVPSVEEVEEMIAKYESELEQLQSTTAPDKQAQIDAVQQKLRAAEELLDAALDGQLGGSAKFATDNDADDASSVDTTNDTKQAVERTTPSASTTTTPTPDNFSRMSTKALRMNSPLALGKLYAELVTAHRITVNLKAGQLLYLPCGWFHEVSTMSGSDKQSIAFNYWFHPPDSTQHDKPYKHEYWPKHWTNIKARIEQMKQASGTVDVS